MKRTAAVKILYFIFLGSLFTLGSCDKAPRGDEANIREPVQPAARIGQEFTVDTARSYIKFTGHGVGKNHPGMFDLSYGKITVYNDTVSAGTFLIDINSMSMEQKGADIKNKLRPHLLSGDFFDAQRFGTARFQITSVIPYQADDREKSLVEGANYYVSGNFTLKDETKNISFPAYIEKEGISLIAKANFDIDRTHWRMNYGNDKTLGDKFISETVNIELHLEARNMDKTLDL